MQFDVDNETELNTGGYWHLKRRKFERQITLGGRAMKNKVYLKGIVFSILKSQTQECIAICTPEYMSTIT